MKLLLTEIKQNYKYFVTVFRNPMGITVTNKRVEGDQYLKLKFELSIVNLVV